MLTMISQLTIKTMRVSGSQLKLFNAKLLNIASFHRPPHSQNESLALIHNDIGNTIKKYKHMQCANRGDLNLSCLNWLEEEILDGPYKSRCDLLVNLMNEYGLSQHSKKIAVLLQIASWILS